MMGYNIVLEALVEELKRTNELQELHTKVISDNGRSSTWANFAVAIIESGKVHLDDVPDGADKMLAHYKNRFR